MPTPCTVTLLSALQLRGVGPVAARRVAAQLAHNLKAGGEPLALSELGFSKTHSAAELADARANAERLIEKCISKSIEIFSILDEQYPRRLAQIGDAPPIVYVKGSPKSLNILGCAVVGTREASSYGLKIAHKISSMCADRHFNVISGLALGIDTAAHEGALSNNGVTLAIMAHGLDVIAPSSNKKLAERIIETGGALLSEHEPGVPPRPPEFVRRNRIQSGIAVCSIIVESGEKGGSIHQARFTHAQGRPVLAVLPEGGPPDFRSDGGRLLVREYGARPMHSSDQVISTVQALVEEELKHRSTSTQAELGV